MATQAQCAYCFETISARLEGRRKQLSLAQVEELWEIYENDGDEEASAQLKAESAQAGAEDEDEEMEDQSAAPTQTRASPYRPAAISRLLNPSPASSSSSSSMSPSAASSTPSLSSNNSGSSRSSIFSLPNRLTRGRKTSSTPQVESDDEEYPLFVTWNKVDKGHKRLAGCIGTFEPYELEEGLNIYSRTAWVHARNDHDRLNEANEHI